MTKSQIYAMDIQELADHIIFGCLYGHEREVGSCPECTFLSACEDAIEQFLTGGRVSPTFLEHFNAAIALREGRGMIQIEPSTSGLLRFVKRHGFREISGIPE